MEEEGHENTNISPDIIMHPSAELEVNSSLEDAKKADLPIMNAVVQFVYASWSRVNSIDSLCKMVKSTNEAIEGRRKVLGLPYGCQNEVSKIPAAHSRFFDPIK